MELYPWVVVVVVWVAMTPLAANPMSELRKAVGLRGRGDPPGDAPRPQASDGELAAARARLRPELVGAIGLVGSPSWSG